MNIIYPWQEDVWRIFSQVAGSGTSGSPRMDQALLLRGRRGIGKLALARSLAKFRLCKNPSVKGEACQSCASCRWFDQGSHPDFRLIEPEAISEMSRSAGGTEYERMIDTLAGAGMDTGEDGANGAGAGESDSAKSRKKPSKQIGVAQIRELADFINISSHQNGDKIILIHPAEAMNPAAANALLKNLEEPPARTLFILVTHHVQHLLPTIRSRCRQIAMPIPDLATATAWLKQQGVKDPALCLASASYAPLAALEFNDDGYLDRHKAFIRQISALEDFNPIALAEEMQKSDLPTVVNWLQKWCYDLMSFRTTRRIRYHLDMLAVIKLLASEVNPRVLATYLRTLNATQRLANHPLNPR
ncbi:MAG: DNA polymerase III subunit delta', partial [Nitrosospira sp.]